jgi:small subunit ribosomal protein S16
MALKIRLARGGGTHRPFYRIVVAENTSPRDGRFVERVGSYNPFLPHDHASRVVLNKERIQHWISVGAKPTERVARFLGQANLMPAFQIRTTPQKSALKKKAQERLKAQQEAIDAQQKAAAEAESTSAEA